MGHASEIELPNVNSLGTTADHAVTRGASQSHYAQPAPLGVLTGNEFVGGFVLQDFNGDGWPDIAVTNIADSVGVPLQYHPAPESECHAR